MADVEMSPQDYVNRKAREDAGTATAADKQMLTMYRGLWAPAKLKDFETQHTPEA